MAENKRVEIKPAKGRPMLSWVGKKPLRDVIAYPAQLVETFAPEHALKPDKNLWKDWTEKFPKGGLLFHGDNKDVLSHLLANGFRGKVKLIYIDPPFASGADYIRKVNLRIADTEMKLNGEGYGLGEQIQYTDIWGNDSYLQFMYERLLILKELLAEDGVIFVHTDWHVNSSIRLILDEIFSSDSHKNEIIWTYETAGKGKKTWSRKHDTIYFYSKSDTYSFYPSRSSMPRKRGKHMILGVDDDGREYEQKTDKATGKVYRWYFDEGKLPMDFWTDISFLNWEAKEREGYPTQKPEELIKRIILTCTNPNDLILDCFLGSGTTTAVAQKYGRRWIGADINKGAIQTTAKRLQGIIEDQLKITKNKAKSLPKMEEEETPPPAQFSFAVYRVNDYDLQTQHNEALNLACEHLGVTRTKTDSYFDGTLGKKLVKIVPFNHPITPLDMEEVKRELGNRPQEERNVVVIGYGKELAVQAWLDDWNRNRKRTGLPNQIEAKDLRVDAKSGGFFVHKPAEVNIKFKREGDKVNIEIETFLSPTIIERLKSQAGVLSPQIDDWRAMVDSVMIDAAYDGKVFNITLADVPEKKNDLVEGKYVVEAKKGAKIAVKITDMLGEEVLVVRQL
jgi:DNA modification methylase